MGLSVNEATFMCVLPLSGVHQEISLICSALQRVLNFETNREDEGKKGGRGLEELLVMTENALPESKSSSFTQRFN